MQPSLSCSSQSWDASGVVLVGWLPPTFCCSSWNGCRAVCTPGTAQTLWAAGWELHRAAVVKDQQGGCTPLAPTAPSSTSHTLCWGPQQTLCVCCSLPPPPSPRHARGWPSPGFEILVGTG